MDPKTAFSSKAANYDKYRWDYPPAAIEAIVEITQLSASSSLADLGAGTGMLAKHFVDKVKRVYAVEPNVEMRQIMTGSLGNIRSISVMDGCAEETNLPDESVDIITVAQAIHWFDPQASRKEMLRILKNNGWLAVLKNCRTDKELTMQTESLMTEAYGADFSATRKRPKEKPLQFYFGSDHFQKMTFPFQFQQDWEGYMGAIQSASFMPDESHPRFKKLEEEARKVFFKFSRCEILTVRGETELFIGQPIQGEIK